MTRLQELIGMALGTSAIGISIAFGQGSVLPMRSIELPCTDAAFAPALSNPVAADRVYGLGVIGSSIYPENGAAVPSLLVDLETGEVLHELWEPQASTTGNFGMSVAIDGDFAVVGAPFETGTQALQGAVYVFSTQTSSLLYRLVANDPAPTAYFGRSMRVVQGRLVVGAPGANGANGLNNTGAAYVFDLNTGLQLLKLAPPELGSGDSYGGAVGIHGGRIAVGARYHNGTGQVFIHNAYSGTQLLAIAPASGITDFGRALAMYSLTMVASANDGLEDTVLEYEVRYGQLLRTYAEPVNSSGLPSALFGRSLDLTGKYLGISESFHTDTALAQGRVHLFPRGSTNAAVALLLDSPQQEDVLGDFISVGLGHVLSSSRRNASPNCHNSLAIVHRIDAQPGVPTAGKAAPDSAGYRPVLWYAGSHRVWYQNFSLKVTGMVPGNMAFFQVSSTPDLVHRTSYIHGNDALGYPTYWVSTVPTVASSSGRATLPINLNHMSVHYPLVALAGQTWYFQGLCRTTENNYVYTNGLRMAFE